MIFPDISEFYRGDAAMKEEAAWVYDRAHNVYYDFVNDVIADLKIRSVVEFGCATGHTAVGVNPNVEYLGIDKNDWFLHKARERCPLDTFPNFQFTSRDLRESLDKQYDLSMAFAVVKHFGLHEVDDIVRRILQAGKYCVLQMQFLQHPEDLDDGPQVSGDRFHHVFITDERMNRVVRDASYRELERKLISKFRHPVAEAANWLILYGKL